MLVKSCFGQSKSNFKMCHLHKLGISIQNRLGVAINGFLTLRLQLPCLPLKFLWMSSFTTSASKCSCSCGWVQEFALVYFLPPFGLYPVTERLSSGFGVFTFILVLTACSAKNLAVKSKLRFLEYSSTARNYWNLQLVVVYTKTPREFTQFRVILAKETFS